jgi:hypothetical protein
LLERGDLLPRQREFLQELFFGFLGVLHKHDPPEGAMDFTSFRITRFGGGAKLVVVLWS